jgi:hypothetical protein
MTILIAYTFGAAAWHTTERRVGTRDEWVALLGSLVGWTIVVALGVV